MEPTYNILWVDDQYEELQAFILEAESENILLEPYKSFEEGFSVLEANLHNYDGVVLDAMFFESKEQEAGSEDLKGLSKAVSKLNELKHKKKLPFFILSGQTRFNSDSTFKEIYGDHYRKSNPDDQDKLFKDIKDRARKLTDTQTRHKYQRVFEVCSSKYLGESAMPPLLRVLNNLEQDSLNHNSNDSKDLFNSLRKILEGEFISTLKAYKLIPLELDKLNNLKPFFEGRNVNGFKLNSSSRPHQQIINILRTVIDLTQDGSHPHLEVEKHVSAINTPYLLYSITFQILDLILWLKQYIDTNSQKEDWISLDSCNDEWKIGTITRIAHNGYGTFLSNADKSEASILPKIIERYNLKEGDQIEVITKSNPRGGMDHTDKIRRYSS